MKKRRKATRSENHIPAWGRDMKERIPAVIAMTAMIVPQLTTYAWAAANPIATPLNSLYDVLASIVSAIGSLILLLGFSEWGIAFQSSEGSMQASGFKRITGGLIMVFAPQLVTLLT